MNKDRNFDDLAEKFQKKVYGGVKGQVRLAVLERDLEQFLPGTLSEEKVIQPLRVLDIGAGFAQLSLRLAQLGHQVTVNDISEKMLAKARLEAEALGIVGDINWHCSPYQQLVSQVPHTGFDLILCHALMEWLAEPEKLVEQLAPLVDGQGWLSLTFYNRHALVYRNLLRGNFRMLEKERLQGDPGSLTPLNPQLPEVVEGYVKDMGFEIVAKSGIRVFNDYVQVPRGGNEHPEAIVETECHFSNQEPYRHLGRYIHFLCRKKPD